MRNPTPKLMEQIIPFIILGIILAVGVWLFIVLSYVVLWGLLFGGLLWVGYFLKNYFFPNKHTTSQSGRVIEHDDNP